MSENNELLRDMLLTGGVVGFGVGYGQLQRMSDNYKNSPLKNTVNSFAQNLPGTDFLENQLLRSSSYSSSTATQLLSSTNQALQKTLLSQLMVAEEMSPLHILRTLQLSNLIQPFTEMSSNDAVIHISSKSLRNQQHYYRSLITYLNEDAKGKEKRLLTNNDLMRGMFFKNNKIYGASKDGKINLDDVVVKNARLSLGAIKNGDIYSYNHIAEKFANTVGGALDKETLRHDPLIFVGSKSNRDFGTKWGKSLLRFSMEVGFKTLDNPLAGIEEMFHGVGLQHTGFFASKPWQTVKKYGNIKLGTGGVYDIGVRDSLKISAKNIAVKGTATYIGYQAVDSVLRTLSPQDGMFSQGVATGLANMYAEGRVGFAKLWSDKFQGYKERQEQAAPGSTDLTTLLAFPLGGALLGSQMSYFSRVGTASIKGMEASVNKYNVETPSKLLSKIGISDKLKPMKKNALLGGLFGAAFTLPFLPGALVGDSSEELKSLYNGEKEVAEKATKLWTFGGGAWEGSHTKFFSQHWVARMKADAIDKVRYGDDATKKSMDPFLKPFSYLKDPYKFEKRNADNMPYPIWGMDVGFGGIFGKAFERTIGQVIKPDKLNPALIDAIDTNTNVIGPNYVATDLNYKGSDVSTEVKNFVNQYNFRPLTIADKGLVNKYYRPEYAFNKNETLPGDINTLIGISGTDASLINDGLLKAPELPNFSPRKEAAGLTYQAFMDFTGIKGWSSSLLVDATGYDPTDHGLQLARSGEAVSSGRDLMEQNLGDLMGLGEFQRKILPTSSGSIVDRFNPIANDGASWLPKDKSKFYIDFRHGNLYDKVERGEERLPGVGFAALNPEVRGLDPEDYPLAYRFKILSNVARGSKEHIAVKEEVIDAYKQGKLSKREIDIVGNTLDQEQAIQQRKTFFEKRNNFIGPVGGLQNNLWEFMRSNAESPLEMLTPMRPVAKFLHKRTAIEDYMETQLGGSDAAIWTNPMSHFIKPTMNKLSQSAKFSGFNKPDEFIEKNKIDEYFDKLDYIRKRRNESPDRALNTVIGSSMSGLNTKEKVLKFKSSLSADQKDYFESFSKETNEKKRERIRSMLPEDVRRGYEQIWRNVDIAKKYKGRNVQEEIAEDLHEQTKALKNTFDVSLSSNESMKAKELVQKNKDSYADLGMSTSSRIKYAEDETLRMKMADREALTYVENRTGIPSSKFLGWDPRLQTDDIKMRTLSIGNKDMKRFGFWAQDERRMEDLSAITDQISEVTTNIERIQREMKDDRNLKMNIEKTMFSKGFKVTDIDLVSHSRSSILVRETDAEK